MSGNSQIVVLGSFMTDVISYVARLPQSGETFRGHKIVICCGGKGANQCVSAARLGANAAMIGKLGDDNFGHTHMQVLSEEKVNTSHVSLIKDALTGVGQIIVEDSGQNSVVTVSGANSFLTPEDVASSAETISKAKVLLCEIEIPRQTVLAGLRLANQFNVLTILNAAPAVSDLESEFYSLSDIFCVNETEAEILTGLPVTTHSEAVAAAERLIQKGCKHTVLLTLGCQGAMYLSRNQLDKPVFVLAPKVQAVDTTGAGDCFLGTLAYFLAYRPELGMEKAVEKACRVASESVQKSGTQPSFPHREQLDAAIFQ